MIHKVHIKYGHTNTHRDTLIRVCMHRSVEGEDGVFVELCAENDPMYIPLKLSELL